MHVGCTQGESGHGPNETGLCGLRGCDLTYTIWDVKKNVEGSMFRGQDCPTKLFSVLDLGGPDDLRSGLRGRLSPKFQKWLFF